MKVFQVAPNDIIMSCSGTVGKFALAPNNIECGIINQALLRFRATEKILPKYLLICLQEITDNLSTHGLGLQNLTSVDSLKIIKIPVPVMQSEQQKIINKIDEIIKNIEKLEQEKDLLLKKQKLIVEQFI